MAVGFNVSRKVGDVDSRFVECHRHLSDLAPVERLVYSTFRVADAHCLSRFSGSSAALGFVVVGTLAASGVKTLRKRALYHTFKSPFSHSLTVISASGCHYSWPNNIPSNLGNK